MSGNSDNSQSLNTNKNHDGKLSEPSLFKALFLKTIIILLAGVVYAIAIAHSPHNSASYGMHFPSHNNNLSPGVCVFDIDYTLKCDGARAAVEACKNAGFDLAINTARGKDKAMEILNSNFLLEKGFDQYFIEISRNQDGLNGPFQYKENWQSGQELEQKFQNKSYGMRNIAKYYNFKLDDIESRKLVLFDDMFHNIVQMQPGMIEPYSSSRCKYDTSGACYTSPDSSPINAAFPRNWKIYRSKWVGYLCSRWNSSQKASEDAIEMIYEILYGTKRLTLSPEVLDESMM